jgi:hypothetical protein
MSRHAGRKEHWRQNADVECKVMNGEGKGD